ncbi:MAG: hypothetical protein Q6363_008435 [Candidatus Njordarchaeota archaeon]
MISIAASIGKVGIVTMIRSDLLSPICFNELEGYFLIELSLTKILTAIRCYIA